MLNIIKPAAVLLIVTFIAAAALGVVYDITKEPIARQKAKNEADAVAALLPDTVSTESSDVDDSVLTKITTCYGNDGEISGYALSAAPKGYGGAIEIMVGFNPAGVIQGVKVLSHSETPGLGANAALPAFTDQYKGKSGPLKVVKVIPSGSDEVEAVTSATITSNAVTAGVNAASDYFAKFLANP